MRQLNEYEKAFSKYIRDGHYARAEAALLNDAHDEQAESDLLDSLRTAFNAAWIAAGKGLPEQYQFPSDDETE